LFAESDIQKLTVDSRQKLTREFAEKHTDLRERARRFPADQARTASEVVSCPLQLATVACLIEMDGLGTIREAVDLLSFELQRRATVGEEIPNIPGSVLEFALEEGRWVEYIRGSFSRELFLRVRELANAERSIDESLLTPERAMGVASTRIKLAETFVQPAVEAWLKDHLKSTGEDVLLSFGPYISGWGRSTVRGKASQVKRRAQAHLRTLLVALGTASDSATIDSLIKRVETLVSSMDTGFRDMPPAALSHLLVQMAPRPTGRGDKSPMVDIGSASTRSFKAEPDLKSPFDFLERDVRLAKRRAKEDRVAYLQDRISRVLRVLKYQGIDLTDSVGMCVQEVSQRLAVTKAPIEDIAQKAKSEIEVAPLDTRDSMAVEQVRSFIEQYVYG